jgi:hypothetical protein
MEPKTKNIFLAQNIVPRGRYRHLEKFVTVGLPLTDFIVSRVFMWSGRK